MDARRFDTFLSQIAQLSRRQCAQLLSVLKDSVDKARATDIVEAAVADKLCCPRCQSRSLYRHGAANGMQRYQCRCCGRTFNSLTGTPLARLRCSLARYGRAAARDRLFRRHVRPAPGPGVARHCRRRRRQLPLTTVDGAGAAINVGTWVNGTFDPNVVMSLNFIERTAANNSRNMK